MYFTVRPTCIGSTMPSPGVLAVSELGIRCLFAWPCPTLMMDQLSMMLACGWGWCPTAPPHPSPPSVCPTRLSLRPRRWSGIHADLCETMRWKDGLPFATYGTDRGRAAERGTDREGRVGGETRSCSGSRMTSVCLTGPSALDALIPVSR